MGLTAAAGVEGGAGQGHPFLLPIDLHHARVEMAEIGVDREQLVGRRRRKAHRAMVPRPTQLDGGRGIGVGMDNFVCLHPQNLLES